MTSLQSVSSLNQSYLPAAAQGGKKASRSAHRGGVLQGQDRVSLGTGTKAGAAKASGATAYGNASGYLQTRQFIARLFQEQGISSRISLGNQTFDINELTQDQAKELISENGVLGVKQTSDRIFDLVTAVAGNDPTKLAAIKAGVERGFAMAGKDFGGALPEISYKTYNAIMSKLDKWAADAGVQTEGKTGGVA